MLDINRFSTRYSVRRMTDNDTDTILSFCLQNTQYYEYCGKQPTRELILNDLHVTPPGIDASAKYYVGFCRDTELVAITDLIEGYPDDTYCFIGFFMMNKYMQGRQIGSEIIRELCDYIRSEGFTKVMLGIDKNNPQSTHFWKKNGFKAVREVEQDTGVIVVAEKRL